MIFFSIKQIKTKMYVNDLPERSAVMYPRQGCKMGLTYFDDEFSRPIELQENNALYFQFPLYIWCQYFRLLVLLSKRFT